MSDLVARRIATASDGTTWYLHADGKLYLKVGNTWEWDGIGKAVQVSVGHRTLMYCVNSSGDIHRCEGARGAFTWTKETAEANKVPRAKHVSVGSDGTVFCISTENKIYERKGNKWEPYAKGGAGVQISVGRRVGNYVMAWVVADMGKLYSMAENGTWRLEGAPGNNDKNVPVAKRVSVGTDGTIWVIATDGKVWRRDTVSGAGHWKEPNMNASLEWISVGDGNHIAGLNTEGTVYDYKGNSWQGTSPQPKDRLVTTTSPTTRYQNYTMPNNGQGLQWVARQKGVTYEALLDANPQYKNSPNSLQAGATLNIPRNV